MSIYTAIISSLLAFNSCLIWAKMNSKIASPVSFETIHTIPVAFWISREYGPKALIKKPNRVQRAAIIMDHLIDNEQLDQ